MRERRSPSRRLKSGEPVDILLDSHIHGKISWLLSKILPQIESGGKKRLTEEIKFKRIVGETSCVCTTDGDEIAYAQRPGRKGLTRFVKNREAELSDSAVIILRKGGRGNYILVTLFVGVLGHPEPWDKRANKASYQYWLNHALVWGTEPIVPGTETSECPWGAR